MIGAGNSIIVQISVFIGLFFTLFCLFTLWERKHYLHGPNPSKLYSISVIVPAFNEESTLAKTLDSLLDLRYPRALLQIIVVDDGSTDSTLSVGQKFEDRGVIVYTKPNGGKGEAVNFGLERATGELVACLDADSFVDSEALQKMIGYFNDPSIMAVTPSMRVLPPKNFLQRIQYIEYMVGVFLRKVFAFLGSVHVTPGPFTVFRRSFFLKYGGFDESTIVEDQEIALRIQSYHYKIDNAMDAHVYTHGVSKFWPLYKQRIRWYRGFLDNIPRYRHLFGRKYGNLGILILPSALISILLSISLILYTVWRFLVNSFNFLLHWRAVNFSFKHFLHPSLDWFVIGLSGVTFLIIIAISLNFISLYIAKKITGERIKLRWSFLLYTLFYGFFFVHWWLGSIWYKVAGKKIRWAGRWM